MSKTVNIFFIVGRGRWLPILSKAGFLFVFLTPNQIDSWGFSGLEIELCGTVAILGP
jgi:hypothetical protein